MPGDPVGPEPDRELERAWRSARSSKAAGGIPVQLADRARRQRIAAAHRRGRARRRPAGHHRRRLGRRARSRARSARANRAHARFLDGRDAAGQAADGRALSARPMIGLPGNPVSTLVCGLLFVRPAIERLLGLADEPRAGADGAAQVKLARQRPAPGLSARQAEPGRRRHARGRAFCRAGQLDHVAARRRRLPRHPRAARPRGRSRANRSRSSRWPAPQGI